MPTAKRYFSTEFCYHIYNRGVEKRITFNNNRDYNRFLESINYYQYKQKIPYSQFLKLNLLSRMNYFKSNPPGSTDVKALTKRVSLLSYCLMPNHFHFIIKQLKPSGISKFLSDLINSYTKYFNTKYERSGYLFQGIFKAKPIRTPESLLQVSRYIHLNPVISKKVSWKGEIKNYPYSSYKTWINYESDPLIDVKQINYLLKFRPKAYKKFVESALGGINIISGIEDLLIESPK